MKNYLLFLATVFCCFATINAQVAITVSGGSFCSEVSWSLTDASGNEVATGTCGDYSVDAADGDCFILTMEDSYGDGWNGNTFNMGDFTAELSSGSSETSDFCYSAPASCTDTEYAWTMGGGSYIGETSFTVTDADGNIVIENADGGEGIACLADGCYEVNMVDSYGDGWNGNIFSINGEDFTMGSGAAATTPLSINGGACGSVAGCMNPNATNYNADANSDDDSCEFSCEYLLSSDSYYDSFDNGFSNYNCNGYVSSGSYTIAEMEDLGYACDCVVEPVFGCTDETASNYNADATEDDGTCEFVLTCGDGEVQADLTMTDSYGDGWNGGSITVVVDGVTVVDAATVAADAASLSACISEGVLAGTSCVQISVASGSYPGEMAWTITAYDGAVTLAAGDGSFGDAELGCAVEGCMDETACNYNADATV